MTHQRRLRHHGSAVVVIPIVGETLTLLIREGHKSLKYWKFIAETVEEGESVLDTLCRGVDEEAGLKLRTKSYEGHVIEIIDPRVAFVRSLISPCMVKSAFPHMRYFWGLSTSDEVISSLSGKHLSVDADESIYTQAFELSELERMSDFLPQHRRLVEQIPWKSGSATIE